MRAWLVCGGVAVAVVVLAVTGMFFDPATPWAYLNSLVGVVLTVAAWRLGLRWWLVVAILPLWPTATNESL
ncbi:hypothetical protein [Gordonia sp. CPCC 205333]|uniref:hypothetical protein n=1 Tax=Gordonia sp. CPCC 205333 TaxID=3140790 RepID=UPI003AF33FDA